MSRLASLLGWQPCRELLFPSCTGTQDEIFSSNKGLACDRADDVEQISTPGLPNSSRKNSHTCLGGNKTKAGIAGRCGLGSSLEYAVQVAERTHKKGHCYLHLVADNVRKRRYALGRLTAGPALCVPCSCGWILFPASVCAVSPWFCRLPGGKKTATLPS